jgi:hypothetical protein
MTSKEKAAVERLLRAGRYFLRNGFPREASDAFGRVLLKDPSRDDARRGVEQARRLETEEWRAHEIDQGKQAAAHVKARLAGRRTVPVSTVGCLYGGGPNDSSRDLMVMPSVPLSFRAPDQPNRASATQSRRALIAICAALFSLAITATAMRWERFVEMLVRAPSPVGREASPSALSAGRTRGERAVNDALRLIEKGDAGSALALLNTIPQADPAYPFSRHLRRRLGPSRGAL